VFNCPSFYGIRGSRRFSRSCNQLPIALQHELTFKVNLDTFKRNVAADGQGNSAHTDIIHRISYTLNTKHFKQKAYFKKGSVYLFHKFQNNPRAYPKEGGCRAAATPNCPKLKFKETYFVDILLSKVLRGV
jgi:hypothetical protein